MIVGGGIRGAAAAYFLARAGARVRLVERGQIANGPSGQDSALINASTKTPDVYTRLSALAAACHRVLARSLNGAVEWDFAGNIPMLAWDAAGLAYLEARARRLNAIEGIEARLLSASELHGLETAISQEILGGLFCPVDGRVNARALTVALIQAAKQFGAEIQQGIGATALAQEAGRVVRAEVNGETVVVDQLVIAAGVDSAQIGAMVGLTIPVVPCRGQIVITQPLPPMLGRPVANLQQDRDGRIYIGSGNEFVGFKPEIDAVQAERQLAGARRILPDLARATLDRVWVGHRPWPVDGQPIIGPAAPLKNVWIATGHSGITLAPLTGEAIARWITEGAPGYALEEFQLGRFARAEYAYAMSAFGHDQAAARPPTR